MKRQHLSTENLARELARIFHMDRDSLISCWVKLYGAVPPANLSRKLLVRALAYRLQEQALGGLRPSTQRLLNMAVKDDSKAAGKLSSALNPGTRLIREWHGHTYEVTVLETGVLFQGKQYRSLTEVARIITGVKWSGPSFFGLKTKKKQDGQP